ncbi:MAG: hypothetical protein ACP5J5_04400 [Dissulfurimicrobium sp.]|uniref:hypothetical protein n=1 Tax=Dissulfurimicrobium TaxID=1769732 RepID=UPI001EDB9F29|nr:hypothetical protein [Dissulfurimicrobium hydrothermale]UKL14070.1 hypothetical protein LGS26_02095 [Dissulfurimicrobium hydrothermale]
MSKPILLGTIHLDRAGEYESLQLMLERIRPEIIAVEISPFSVRYRQKNQKKWLTIFNKRISSLTEKEGMHSGLELLKLQITTPFEWEVANIYGKNNNIPVIAIDCGDIAKKDMPYWEKTLLSLKNISNILKLQSVDIDDYFERHHQYALNFISRPMYIPEVINPLRWLNDETWSKREALLETKMRRILKTNKKSLYIGGWMHIVMGSPYKTLAERLSDLNPECILLKRRNKKS